MKVISTVDPPSSGRQSIDIGALSMKGKSAFGAPSMKDKSADLPREGKKEENPQSQSTLAERNLGIRQRVDTWIKSARIWCNTIQSRNHDVIMWKCISISN